jgi:hypothetical protein
VAGIMVGLAVVAIVFIVFGCLHLKRQKEREVKKTEEKEQLDEALIGSLEREIDEENAEYEKQNPKSNVEIEQVFVDKGPDEAAAPDNKNDNNAIN